MYGDLRLSFIQKNVNEYMAEVEKGMAAAGVKYKMHIGEGIASISYASAVNGAAVNASLTFKEYLRMVDMGVGNGHPLGGLTQVSVALKASNRVGDVFTKDNVRRPKKIYSKTAYGNLTYLYNKLLYGFTEEARAILKQELEQKQNTQPE